MPLGRTVGFKANGAVSNLSFTPYGLATAQKELRTGRYDVVHVHEPIAPIAAMDDHRLDRPAARRDISHLQREQALERDRELLGARRMLNRLRVRIAVSEAAAWTGRRFFGGHYRIDPQRRAPRSRARRARSRARPQGDELRIVFVGQAVERKGLPLLLRAFEALRERIPTELTVIGPTADELSPLLLDMQGVRVLGKVDDETKERELEQADLLVAPSLRGESFGMVLTEAFAAGTPVVASDIPGYRDVVRDGVDGVLVPPGDAQALAEVLRDLYEEPARRAEMARAAARDVARFAWPRVAEQVMGAYEDAIATPEPETRTRARGGQDRTAVRRPQAARSRAPAADASSRGRDSQRRSRAKALARRGALAAVTLGGIALAYSRSEDRDRQHRLRAGQLEPNLRAARAGGDVHRDGGEAFSWDAILKAALPARGSG